MIDAVPAAQLERLAAEAPEPGPPANGRDGPRPPRRPPGDVERRARAYLKTLDDAVAGQHGHDRLYHAACVLVDGFGLSPEEALPIFRDWNAAKAAPPESEAQLRHKLDDALKNTARSGHLLRDRPPGRPAAGEADRGAAAAARRRLVTPEDVVTVCLAAVEATAVRWLWPDHIPLGKVSLLAGEAKLGKSFATMDLAARVSVGGPVPCGGGATLPRGSVVLLSAEDDLDDTIKPRLVAAGADVARVHALTTVRRGDGTLGPFNLSYVTHLEVALDRFGDTRLLVIDPITHYIGPGTDDNRATQLREVLGPLKVLAADAGVAVVIVSHMNKGNSPKALNRVIGSGAYTALARANWLFVRDPEDPKRRLMLDGGNNLAEDPHGLAYRIVDGRVAWEDDPITLTADDVFAANRAADDRPGERGPIPARTRAAMDWLTARFAAAGHTPQPHGATRAAAEEAGISTGTFYNALGRLQVNKDLVVDGRKYLEWTRPVEAIPPDQAGPPF